jgi:hypothetical protein
MKVELKLINEVVFNESNLSTIFNVARPRCYGILVNKDYSYKLGWQSEIVNPKINEISDNVYSIGIDLNFAIIDFEKGNVVLNLSLDYFFYDTKLQNGFIYVITELLIIKINQMTYEVIEKFSLPDFFNEIIFNNNTIEIKCLNDEIVCYPN